MNRPLKKYVIVATIITLTWLSILVYFYVRYTSFTDIVAEEIYEHSQTISKQIFATFEWFEQREHVYVTKPSTEEFTLPEAAYNTTFGGQILTHAIPINLMKKLEKDLKPGVTMRFVSNVPFNMKNLPSEDESIAITNMASEGLREAFVKYKDDANYHYISPIFATKSCISCHTDVAEGGFMGAAIIDTNSDAFLILNRSQNHTLIGLYFAGSMFTILLFYFFVLRFWRKYNTQGDDLAYNNAMIESMSHSAEVIFDNVTGIIKELQQEKNSAESAELLRTLQYISEDLLHNSRSLQNNTGKTQIHNQEELIHIDTFFRQCVQIFLPASIEKGIELTLKINNIVPVHVLGNAFCLRQIIGFLIKNAVEHTNSGYVCVSVNSAHTLATKFSTKDLAHPPIHLVIEVEDSSAGYIIADKKKYLPNASAKKQQITFEGRQLLDLSPVNELAFQVNGGVRVLHNSKTGATFAATVQVKLIDEDTVTAPAVGPNMTPVRTEEDFPLAATNAQTQNLPQHAKPAASIASVASAQLADQRYIIAPQNHKAQGAANTKITTNTSTQATPTTQGTQQSAQQNIPQVKHAPTNTAASTITAQAKPIVSPTATSAPTQLSAASSSAQPQMKKNVRVSIADLPEQGIAAPLPQGPISIIIGDCGIPNLTSEHLAIFKEHDFNAQLMSSADEIFKTLDSTDHGYSVVLLRELSDFDIIYTATRIRYLERLGSTPVAIVLIAEDMLEEDMDVLRFFNISTVDNFPRDSHIAVKVSRLALQTKGNKIFQGGKLLDQTTIDGDVSKLFDIDKALENTKRDKKLIQSICSMWIRFYPEQISRLRAIIKDGNNEDKLRLLRSIKNSAGTVSLPMLGEETNRLIEKISQEEDVRFEKLLAIYENTYEYLKKYMQENS